MQIIIGLFGFSDIYLHGQITESFNIWNGWRICFSFSLWILLILSRRLKIIFHMKPLCLNQNWLISFPPISIRDDTGNTLIFLNVPDRPLPSVGYSTPTATKYFGKPFHDYSTSPGISTMLDQIFCKLKVSTAASLLYLKLIYEYFLMQLPCWKFGLIHKHILTRIPASEDSIL